MQLSTHAGMELGVPPELRPFGIQQLGHVCSLSRSSRQARSRRVTRRADQLKTSVLRLWFVGRCTVFCDFVMGFHYNSPAPHPTQAPATSSSQLDAADLRPGGER